MWLTAPAMRAPFWLLLWKRPRLTIKVETADSTAGPYEPVKDGRIFVDNPVNEDGEAVIENEAEAQAVANLDIDLIGCKSCVKITATNGTIGALALGDATNCPVKESI